MKARPGPKPYPVRVRNRTFASAKAAAEFYGIEESSVRRQIAEGRADFIGIGKGGWWKSPELFAARIAEVDKEIEVENA